MTDFEDEFEVFYKDLSLDTSVTDLGPHFSPIIDEMGIQRKPKSSLLELIENQPGRDAPRRTVCSKSPTPPPVLPPPQPADLKRKREPKGKGVMEAGQTLPSWGDEVQRASKQAKTGQREAEKRSDLQVGPLVWLSAPMLNGEPLLANASICNFQGRTAGYVADAMEQVLLLLEDMAGWRGVRRHKVFLNLKRYLVMVWFCLNPFLFFCFFFT